MPVVFITCRRLGYDRGAGGDAAELREYLLAKHLSQPDEQVRSGVITSRPPGRKPRAMSAMQRCNSLTNKSTWLQITKSQEFALNGIAAASPRTNAAALPSCSRALASMAAEIS